MELVAEVGALPGSDEPELEIGLDDEGDCVDGGNNKDVLGA